MVIICAVAIALVLLIYTLIFERKSFLMLINHLKSIFASSKRKKIEGEK